MKICRENPYLFKIGHKIGTLHELLRKFYCSRRHKLASKPLLCNIQYFHILTVKFKSTIHRAGFVALSIATVVMQTRHIITLYEHCLCCLFCVLDMLYKVSEIRFVDMSVIADLKHYYTFNAHVRVHSNYVLPTSLFS